MDRIKAEMAESCQSKRFILEGIKGQISCLEKEKQDLQARLRATVFEANQVEACEVIISFLDTTKADLARLEREKRQLELEIYKKQQELEMADDEYHQCILCKNFNHYGDMMGCSNCDYAKAICYDCQVNNNLRYSQKQKPKHVAQFLAGLGLKIVEKYSTSSRPEIICDSC